jgi:hypothetical protein
MSRQTNGGWIEAVPKVEIELLADGNVRVTDEHMGDSYSVDLHPIHLRLIAEKVGLIEVKEESDSAATPGEQARTIDRLKRNLLRVREHSLQLQNKFATGADWKHADLSFEMGLINSLVDLLDMAVDDFADDFTARDPVPYTPLPKVTTEAEPSDNPAETQRVDGAGKTPPKTGGLKTTESGAVAGAGQLELAP